MPDRLRALWDFDDLDAIERRFRALLDREESEAGRAEVLTQLARVHGLRGDFEQCAQVLDSAEPLAGSSPVAKVRLELERGRMYRSSGDSEAALRLFQSAWTRASEAGEHYLAADAAHMAAIAVPDLDAMEEWTRRGLELGEREPDAAYWAGPLLNNLAWAHHDAGAYDRALDLFQQALEARERDPDNEAAIALARYGVGATLRALGRAEQAVGMLAPAVAWAEGAGKPDAYFHAELAEAYAALQRDEEAAEQAELALAVLETDPSFEADDDRPARLRRLAAGRHPR